MALSIKQTMMRCLANKVCRGLNSMTKKSWRNSRKRRRSFRNKKKKDRRSWIRYGESRKSSKPKSELNWNSNSKNWRSKGGRKLTKSLKRSTNHEKSRKRCDSSATVNTWEWSKRRELNLHYIAGLKMTIVRDIGRFKDNKGSDTLQKGNQLFSILTIWSWSSTDNFMRKSNRREKRSESSVCRLISSNKSPECKLIIRPTNLAS